MDFARTVVARVELRCLHHRLTHKHTAAGGAGVGGYSHVYRWGVSRAAVSVGVQVVKRAVELLVGRLQQGRRAAAQRAWGAAS